MPSAEASSAAPGPLLREPWLAVALASIVLLVVRLRGVALGEPVADDFDHIHHALFSADHSWLGGGGSRSFWRPLAYQGYYGLLHRVILSHPAWITLLHVALLALVVVLLFDIARRHLPAPAAATLAMFPVLLESARALVIVPVHFVDLGLIVFSVLAWRAAEGGRLVPALAALAAALLCKETAVATAAVLPWLARPRPGENRRRWWIATAALTALWAAVYVAVRMRLALALPHGLEARLHPALLWDPARYAWALAGTLRAGEPADAAGGSRGPRPRRRPAAPGSRRRAARHERSRASAPAPRARLRRARAGVGRARHGDAPHCLPGVVARARRLHEPGCRDRAQGLEAWCLGGLDRLAEAESTARRSLAIAPENADGHLTLAAIYNDRAEWPQLLAQLDTLESWYPGYPPAVTMRRTAFERMRSQPPRPAPGAPPRPRFGASPR